MTKKKARIPMKGGHEYDALTSAREFYTYLSRAGVAKAIKKKYNKRFRRHQKEELRKGDDDAAWDATDAAYAAYAAYAADAAYGAARADDWVERHEDITNGK